MSQILGRKMGWTDRAEIRINNGKVRIDSNGRITIDGDFEIASINES